ncbi:hypothetical protein L2750_11085 [Shewanella submarina]|uniref:PilZ domain-containing protein n=1 Tax=Shewanella submarina TaxID=2016376 RepID=A0ABV7GAJ7_9GAMM|nr:hypothetical protein [Shewanella submarina]MCL1037695.1 hypothetical protein [Shewanella submarina]
MISSDNSYFNVPHEFTAYLEPWQQESLPDETALKEMQSVGLKLITEVKELENACLLQLRNLDNEAKAVVDFLKLQSRKVDLVLQYVLEKETQHGQKHPGLSFGGSGFTISSATPLTVGQQFKTTLYIREELINILCIATVTATSSEDGIHRGQLEYSAILESDIEQLVQASLRVQQKQLRARKQAQAGS